VFAITGIREDARRARADKEAVRDELEEVEPYQRSAHPPSAFRAGGGVFSGQFAEVAGYVTGS
jgi:hypothetical protein